VFLLLPQAVRHPAASTEATATAQTFLNIPNLLPLFITDSNLSLTFLNNSER